MTIAQASPDSWDRQKTQIGQAGNLAFLGYIYEYEGSLASRWRENSPAKGREV